MSIKSVIPRAGLLAVVFAVLLGLAGDVLACCGSMPDNRPMGEIIAGRVGEASAVFSGKVIGFAYRKGIPHEYAEGRVKELGLTGYKTKVVIFAVDRGWKGDLAKKVELYTEETLLSNGNATNSSMNYSYEVGKSYVVSAYQTPHGLTTIICNGLTGPADSMKDILTTHIGEGNKPVPWKAPTKE